MKNIAILKANNNCIKTQIKENCLSPSANMCSYLEEMENCNEGKILICDTAQEKICSECIWSRKK